MIIFKRITDLKRHLAQKRLNGIPVNFVPTMGALHDGHISLLNKAKEQKGITACSIFINPTQFNNADDFAKYPQTTDADVLQLETVKCDILFLPDVNEMYPKGTQNTRKYNLGYLETILEGEFRPGHFQGVCQVVNLLLDIVEPDTLFLGQKDYQQCMVIQKLLSLTGKNTRLIICPTQREQSGLAMSSRNLRLIATERNLAPEIFNTLLFIKNNIAASGTKEILNKAKEKLSRKGFIVEYLVLADAHTLELLDKWDSKRPIILLIAVYLNNIRLIDNLLL